MYQPPPVYETVFKTRRRRECLELRLVLDAVGIHSEAVQRDAWWVLVVPSDDLDRAASELHAYRQENSDRSPEHNTPVPIYPGAVEAVVVYAAVIMLIATLAAREAFGLPWLTAGRMQAGSVVAGQWWRTVTALTLHLDAGHIVANLIFGAVFGSLAGRVFGGGVAWLAIVIAGAGGNFMNAILQPPTHLSIGASTAVFAALGMLVSHSLRPRAPVQERLLRRWSPLIGGILLLAFIGVGGERTDVAAHVTGFLAGLVIGWLGCRLPARWLASCRVQQWAGLAAIALVALAWMLALAAPLSAD